MLRPAPLLKIQAKVFQALAHPARLGILSLLRAQPLTVQEMQDMTALPQAKLSQHLQILRTERVVMAVRNGRHIKYRLTHPDFVRAADFVQAILAERHHVRKARTGPISSEASVIDPVCDMKVHPATAPYADSYKGTMEYFCGRGCYQRFHKHPEHYV